MRREAVRSRANPLFKRLAALKRQARSARGAVLIEGEKLLEEALLARLPLLEVVLAESVARSPQGRALASRLARLGLAVQVLDGRLLDQLSEVEASPGVLAIARAPRFEEERIFRGTPLVLVAAAIQNPGNLGGLLRSAEAAGATGAWLSEDCADPFSWKSLRGSMGSAFRLPQRQRVPLAALAGELKARGVALVAADPRAPLPYDRADWRRPVAILVGNEAAGLPRSLLDAVDLRVAVPLAPPVESLNVSVAAGILLFEAARQRRAARGGAD